MPANTAFFRALDNVALPAPLPGYALALFIPLARLPLEWAGFIWMMFLLGAVGVTLLALRRLTGFEYVVLVAAIILSDVLFLVPTGQLVPVVVAAICLCGLWLRSGNYLGAGVAAAATMIEPNIGLAVCVAIFVWCARTRGALVVCAIILAGLSLEVLGISRNAEYLLKVLPAQALSEISSDTQYGLAGVLARLGVETQSALRWGLLSYIAMFVIGIAAAGRLAQKTLDPACLAVVPAAFVLLGGTYLHAAQLAAALPAALLLSSVRRSRIFGIALVLLAVPWEPVVRTAYLAPIAILVVLLLSWSLSHGNMRLALAASLLATFFILIANWAFIRNQPAFSPSHVLRPDPHALAESSWGIFMRNHYAVGNPIVWWSMGLTWIGLLALISGVLRDATIFHRKSSAS
ncbi:MAG TPA: glycosyltransferase family 87 protein [Candidatus Rubrimentiphilum sp.]|nr:glycosyltransferase family 87 protein [Candidatus Rubrimentiphilum sp.]